MRRFKLFLSNRLLCNRLLSNRLLGVCRALAVTVILLPCSCSQIQGKLLVMEGNFFSSHGRYTEAIASYLRAQDYDEARPYAEFGLGSVYFALDEKDAALERFAVAEEALRKLPGGYEDLLYHIHYNSGVVRFRAEDFTGAADEFIAALKAGSTHIEAKRNLELSLLSLERGSSGVSAEEEPQVSDQNATLFEYLRQKEQDLWKSQEWIEEAAASGPDY